MADTPREPSSAGSEDPFEKLARELDADFAAKATIKEPSAAERARRPGMLARKRAARRARRGERLRESERRTAAGEGSPRGRRIGTVLALIVMAAGLITIGRANARWPFFSAARTGHTPVATVSSAPAAPPANPFAGTPAAVFADGPAGIALPPAHAVGEFTPARVATAYRVVKQLLIAAHLDPQTLAGGVPTAFAALLQPQQRAMFLGDLGRTGVDSRGNGKSTRAWVTSFAPGTVQFIGHVVKVHGSMSARQAVVQGTPTLQVHVDYLFVYPVQRPGQPSMWVRIVDRSYGTVDFYWRAEPRGRPQAWLQSWNAGGAAGGVCDMNDGFIHPDFPGGVPSKVQPTGVPIDPYDQSHPPPTSGGCHATTRT